MKRSTVAPPEGRWDARSDLAEDARLVWKTSEVLVALHDHTGLAGEQYRKLGLKIEALNETLAGSMKLVIVTSPLMGDGKTATAANLAITLAREEGRQVALVDCDVRNPRIHALFERAPRRGLLPVLTGSATLASAVERTEVVPLDVYALPAGLGRRFDPMPLERIRSLFARLRDAYDLVVCDAPPVLPVADTAALARLADGVLVVVRAASTPRHAVAGALAAIDRNKLIGFVLNAVSERTVAAYYYPYKEGEDGEPGNPKT
jgi:capsular exopolysaccharide synthesis family protein